MELAEQASTPIWVEHLRYFLEQLLLFLVDFRSYLHHYLLRFLLHFLPPLPLPFLLHLRLLGTKRLMVF